MAEYSADFPSSGRYAYESPVPLRRPSGAPAVSRPGRYQSVSPAFSSPSSSVRPVNPSVRPVHGNPSVRPVQGNQTVRPVQGSAKTGKPLLGTSKLAPQGTNVVRKPRRVPQYDSMDRGPEDRFQVPNGCQDWIQQVRSSEFDLYDPLVTGVFIINGVNYAKYEYIKENIKALETFHEAIKNDVVSEIGNAVRADDIIIKIYPGQIKTVVLHYNEQRRRVAGLSFYLCGTDEVGERNYSDYFIIFRKCLSIFPVRQ